MTDHDQAALDDLRTTSESIRDDAQHIDALEAEKAALDPDDPKAAEISRRIVELAGRMQRATLVEQDLIEEAGSGSEHAGANGARAEADDASPERSSRPN
jgi:hypothetical protein